MKILALAILCALGGGAADAAAIGQHARQQQHAENVRIVRDNWGIAHIYGKTDADTVFGIIYAQAEDDFGRIERNYLISLGMLAQAEGESAIYSDLRQRLFVDPRRLRQAFRESPAWLKTLMVAWSDGLNYFLSKHPAVTPKVIRHFEPWMALSFTEGSIGGDIESVDLPKLREFYCPANRARRRSPPLRRLRRRSRFPAAPTASPSRPGAARRGMPCSG